MEFNYCLTYIAMIRVLHSTYPINNNTVLLDIYQLR